MSWGARSIGAGYFPVAGALVGCRATPGRGRGHWMGRPPRGDGPLPPLLGRRLRSANPQWEVELAEHSPSYIADHCVGGATVLPAAALLEMGLAAAARLYGDAACALEQVEIPRALTLAADSTSIVQ